MNKNFLLALTLFICLLSCKAQNVSEAKIEPLKSEKPRLVVGIVVDQMRYDYLTRFYNRFGEAGFKRLVEEGFNCKNNHFNYVPTYTGPGHASIFTGTTPKYHGIIANNWYDKDTKEWVYCAGDDSVASVGTIGSIGQMSPHRLTVTTFADENRLFTQMRGKSIGISLKDRGAVLPVGHTANAAYWFSGKKEGRWISSSHYFSDLPEWVKRFNAAEKAKAYLKRWETYYDIETYVESGPDLNDFEEGFKGKSTATFPYELESLSANNGGLDILKVTPFGNSLTTDFALAALDGEQLGADDITDVLTVSYSSTDYVGHNFGVNSKEIEDTYIRLDMDLARLFSGLDQKVGKGNYTVFLTADHGAVDVPSYLKSVKIPSGYLDNEELKTNLKDFAEKTFGATDLIEHISNHQVFLNRDKIEALKISLEEVQEVFVEELITYPNIYKVYSAKVMRSVDFVEGIEALLQKGYNQKRSGDILLVPDPAYVSYMKTGSTHGSGMDYDTHVPLLFFGKSIAHGETFERTDITDIAPTMSALLGIAFPNGNIGKPLGFLLR